MFVDTPGIFEPRRRLDEAKVATAWSSARDADLAVLLVDVERGLTPDVEKIISEISSQPTPVVLLLNKIDCVPREQLLELTKKANDLFQFDQTFMVSALNGDGCQEFMDYVSTALPAGPFLYPEDQISDLPMRLLAAEVTREKLFSAASPGVAIRFTRRNRAMAGAGRWDPSVSSRQSMLSAKARKKLLSEPKGRQLRLSRPVLARNFPRYWIKKSICSCS